MNPRPSSLVAALRSARAVIQEDRDEMFGSITVNGDPSTIEAIDTGHIERLDTILTEIDAALAQEHFLRRFLAPGELDSYTLHLARVAYEAHDKVGRAWVPSSLWDDINREAAARVAALASSDATPRSTPDDTLAALRAARDFIQEEAANRSDAGSEYSDYEREPRDLVTVLDAAIAAAEGR